MTMKVMMVMMMVVVVMMVMVVMMMMVMMVKIKRVTWALRSQLGCCPSSPSLQAAASAGSRGPSMPLAASPDDQKENRIVV